MYFALAGTDTQILVDMLTELFGEPEMMSPEEFDAPETKCCHTEGMKEEQEC